jgi:hypothetical protein
VTKRRGARHHGAVPASVTVWAVELTPGSSLEEVKGSLALASDGLLFTPREETRPPRRIPLDEIAQARRLRGSPVLMIVRRTTEGPQRTAFYFVQPPPLERADELPRPSLGFGMRGGGGKRKVRRQNVSYLGLWNKEKKAVLREWERQVKAALAARGGS